MAAEPLLGRVTVGDGPTGEGAAELSGLTNALLAAPVAAPAPAPAPAGTGK